MWNLKNEINEQIVAYMQRTKLMAARCKGWLGKWVKKVKELSTNCQFKKTVTGMSSAV